MANVIDLETKLKAVKDYHKYGATESAKKNGVSTFSVHKWRKIYAEGEATKNLDPIKDIPEEQGEGFATLQNENHALKRQVHDLFLLLGKMTFEGMMQQIQ